MQYAMVIDLHKCAGCGACGMACKTENNTDNRKNGQAYNWADFQTKWSGKFPDVSYEIIPVLCNHCSNAACVEVCPVTPKAMFKTETGITMHNNERCIGCRSCQQACPYSKMNLETEDSNATSVISFNFDGEKTHEMYRSKEEMIAGCTASGAEIASKTGATPPYKTEYKHPDYEAVRRPGIVGKCILCEHRLKAGEEPYCTTACPAQTRIVGDIDNPNSKAAKLLKKYRYWVRKPEAGTKPNVYYIREFKSRS